MGVSGISWEEISHKRDKEGVREGIQKVNKSLFKRDISLV
jgi:hypothetical protein